VGPLRQGAGQTIELGGPALGLIEVQSIARGVTVSDAMVKRAAVQLVLTRPVSPGKHLSLCSGEVAEVQEAMLAGRERAGTTLCDELLLTQVHEEVLAVLRRTERRPLDPDLALGILETFSAAATLLGADTACKAAEVTLSELRLCDGLGGKGFAILTGEQDMVEAALSAVQQRLTPGLYLGHELIARPHPELLDSLLRQ
jgi:microcompartment protein CcmL/EutN